MRVKYPAAANHPPGPKLQVVSALMTVPGVLDVTTGLSGRADSRERQPPVHGRRELTFLATGTTPQYPLNGGLNLTLGLLNFGMGYLLHKMKQQQELIIGDLYPKVTCPRHKMNERHCSLGP